MNCADWDIHWTCDIDGVDPDLLEKARLSAQETLWAMSGRRYGVCETTESYRMACDSPCYVPYRDNFGPGVEYRLGGDRRRCCAIHLAQNPVRGVVEVKVMGEVQDPDTYYLGKGVLYRIGQCFPCERDCELPPVEVTYTYGIDPPALASFAMGELACEFLAALTDADCRLPSNAISVTRQGVTVDLGTAETLFDQNRLGLPLVDQFLRNANPNKLVQRSAVYSPDLARRMR